MIESPKKKKKMGRPRIGSIGMMVRLPPEQLADLDAWIAERYAPGFMSRPAALRHLAKIALRDDKAGRPDKPAAKSRPPVKRTAR